MAGHWGVDTGSGLSLAGTLWGVVTGSDLSLGHYGE